MVRSWADGRKKRKSDSAVGTEPARKKSKSEVIEANEKLELEDSTGLEQKYIESIIGISCQLLPHHSSIRLRHLLCYLYIHSCLAVHGVHLRPHNHAEHSQDVVEDDGQEPALLYVGHPGVHGPDGGG